MIVRRHADTMKTILFFLLAAAGVHADGMKLVWSDEFDRAGMPDASKWNYEEGFVRNQEEQYYTRARKENARVEDGMLVIEARKEKMANKRHQAGSNSWSRSREFAEYTSAAVVTWEKVDWQYGRIEVRAQLPQGKGMWPAIWMLGTNHHQAGWPRCGEIDILEQLGRMPDTIHGTLHWAAEDGKHRSNGGKTQSETPPGDGFHVYAIEWNAHRIDWFFDGAKYHTVDLDKMPETEAGQFRKPFYLLINLAIGGSWGGEVDPSVFPQKFLIDYVRVYREVKR
jgi:beta-glucanase (GH16 family)